MKTQQAEYTEGIGEDGTILTYTPQPSEWHVLFYNPQTNSENWGIEAEPVKMKAFLPNKALGQIVASGGFIYWQVEE